MDYIGIYTKAQALATADKRRKIQFFARGIHYINTKYTTLTWLHRECGPTTVRLTAYYTVVFEKRDGKFAAWRMREEIRMFRPNEWFHRHGNRFREIQHEALNVRVFSFDYLVTYLEGACPGWNITMAPRKKLEFSAVYNHMTNENA